MQVYKDISSKIREIFARYTPLIEPLSLVCNFVNSLIHFAAGEGGITLFGEISIRHLKDGADVVARPVKDREMSARTIEVQTMAGRALPKGVGAFLEELCRMVD